MGQKENNQDRPSLGREIFSVVGVFASLFLLLCLVSYSLPPTAVDAGAVAGNWGGKVGNFLAEALLGFFGLASLWLPLLFLIFSIRFFSPSLSLHKLPFIVAGFTGILLASSGLVGMGGFEILSLLGRRYPGQGYLGKLLAAYASKFFGIPGSGLIFGAILVVSLMLTIDFSPYGLWGWLRDFLSNRFLQGKGKPEIEKKSVAKSKDKPLPQESLPVEPSVVPKVHVHAPVQLTHDDGLAEEFQLLPETGGEYVLPGLALLDKPEKHAVSVDREYYYEVSKKLEDKLNDFGVKGKVVGISPGPVITTYEFSPAPGVKINKIISLADDLALGLKAESVRIVGSIPGKAALGIEIPNPERQIVYARDIFAHEKFQKTQSKLTIGLGMDVVGNPVIADLARMPHLLIAGATGSGKSVAVNTIICSILFNATPDEVRLLLVDPKRIELSGYEHIPHLLHPVVVDPKMASRALQWAVREMERRYQLMEEARVKSLASYNKVAEIKLPLIVIIIDELADLMMVSSNEVEDAVARLAQMARAAGMHLILATQRPSVDVLTGLIKANFPTRMSFKVSSKIDSRTILDGSGAEHLLGAGDMLFMPPGTSKLQRIHGAYISEKETERVVSFLKDQQPARYDEAIMKIAEEPDAGGGVEDGEYDEKYDEAVALVCESGQASISMVQRRLRVGYNRAARMIEVMEKEGVVGPADGSKPREVIARKDY
ncbi:MAG: DNA translocase FtsK 4TM domain-containing protein [Desulfobulbaceae bacterium]|nr:DNA translocase FtsK 4TM domain-containing protein [Desulfobulbaceae bacterium]HIJ79645.1 DUF87 domain-containing protein [Deltaproteobacteria bacterium]